MLYDKKISQQKGIGRQTLSLLTDTDTITTIHYNKGSSGHKLRKWKMLIVFRMKNESHCHHLEMAG